MSLYNENLTIKLQNFPSKLHNSPEVRFQFPVCCWQTADNMSKVKGCNDLIRMSQVVHHPVDTGLPTVLEGAIELALEVLQCLIILHVEDQGLPQIMDGVIGKFRNATGEHHGKQGDEKTTAPTQDHESVLATFTKAVREERERNRYSINLSMLMVLYFLLPFQIDIGIHLVS